MAALTATDIADLRDPVRRLCAERFDRSEVLESGRPATLDLDSWRALADIGVLGALAPAELGGVELPMPAVAALLEECGYGLAPGPLVWNCLAATQVEGVATGEVVVSGALHENAPTLIEHGDLAELILLIDGDIRIHDREALTLQTIVSVDPLTALARLSEPTSAGTPLGDAATAMRWRATGACLTASYLVGLSRRALDLALSHARNREQFGRPIGSFQAIKHLAADMLVGIELSAAAVGDAAEELDADSRAITRSCAAAKILASESAARAVKHCIQIHGAMGFAWEAEPHLLWKRAMVYEHAFGRPDEHAETVAAILGETP